jgi:YHS domain-containing protein
VTGMTILRLLVAVIIFYLLYRIARWLFLSSAKTSEPIPNRQAPAITEDLVEDPCCHTYLPLSQAYQASIDGKTGYFCSEKCYRTFIQKKES